MRRVGKAPPNAVLERLRQGALPSSAAHEVAADAASLKAIIGRLRAEGFVIESEPDPDRKTASGAIHRKAVRYLLKSEPKGLS